MSRPSSLSSPGPLPAFMGPWLCLALSLLTALSLREALPLHLAALAAARKTARPLGQKRLQPESAQQRPNGHADWRTCWLGTPGDWWCCCANLHWNNSAGKKVEPTDRWLASCPPLGSGRKAILRSTLLTLRVPPLWVRRRRACRATWIELWRCLDRSCPRTTTPGCSSGRWAVSGTPPSSTFSNSCSSYWLATWKEPSARMIWHDLYSRRWYMRPSAFMWSASGLCGISFRTMPDMLFGVGTMGYHGWSPKHPEIPPRSLHCLWNWRGRRESQQTLMSLSRPAARETRHHLREGNPVAGRPFSKLDRAGPKSGDNWGLNWSLSH